MLRMTPVQLIAARDRLMPGINAAILGNTCARMNVALAVVTAPIRNLKDQVTDVLEHFNTLGEVEAFLEALTAENGSLAPDVRALVLEVASQGFDRRHIQQIPRGGKGADLRTLPAAGLEKKIAGNDQEIDAKSLLQNMVQAIPRICRIEIGDGAAPGKALGTGVLIGPDLVLTNWHVWEPVQAGQIAAHTIFFRFDYARPASGQGLLPGFAVTVKPGWQPICSPYAPGDEDPAGAEANADQLDYCILRLSEAVALRFETGASQGTPPRGHYDLSRCPAVPAADRPVHVLGHPDGHPATVSSGQILRYVAQGRRLRHDAFTLPGASGSPVFDANWLPVALHHASDPDKNPEYNQAIPLTLIWRHAKARLAAAGAGGA